MRYIHPPNDDILHDALKRIKENDGFVGAMKETVRTYILHKNYATVEVSPHTGMDIQWTLTSEGKKHLTELNRRARYRKKNKNYRNPRAHKVDDVVVPITIEVLDALKSIRENGHPNTTKLDILARIQRDGAHGAVTKQEGREYITKYAALANCSNGVWTLTEAGKRVEAGHIRKTECAQFSGKVR